MKHPYIENLIRCTDALLLSLVNYCIPSRKKLSTGNYSMLSLLRPEHPHHPTGISRPFVVEFVNEIALMAPRNAEDDGLQLFIFSFAHKLWVKCIEYSSFVFFCFANIVLYLLLLSIMMFPNIVIPTPLHSPHSP